MRKRRSDAGKKRGSQTHTQHAVNIPSTVLEEEEEETLDITPRDLFRAVECEMRDRTVGNEDTIRCLLLSVLSREHVLLVGRWGCNKTGMINTLSRLLGVHDHTFFATLDKFSTPDVLLGPWSINGMREGLWVREINGYLPTADFAFIGEVFSGNSATRRALHTVMNERYFEQGGTRLDVPLQTMFCDSNMLPVREEDMPFYDRILLRHLVTYVEDSKTAFQALLTAPDSSLQNGLAPVTCRQDLEAAQTEIVDVTLPKNIVVDLFKIRMALHTAEAVLSDRRWKRCIGVLKAQAWLCGRNQVEQEDLAALRFVMWETPEHNVTLAGILAEFIGTTAAGADELVLEDAQAVYAAATKKKSVDSTTLADALATLTPLQDKLKTSTAYDAVASMINEVERRLILVGGD